MPTAPLTRSQRQSRPRELTRGFKHDPRYTLEWRRLRRMKLSIDPVCEVCERMPATQVHHRKCVRENIEDALRMENLLSVCVPCHAKVENAPGKRAKWKKLPHE